MLLMSNFVKYRGVLRNKASVMVCVEPSNCSNLKGGGGRQRSLTRIIFTVSAHFCADLGLR